MSRARLAGRHRARRSAPRDVWLLVVLFLVVMLIVGLCAVIVFPINLGGIYV
ncbi:MAG: hypothetical protein ACRDTG_29075 [Pseudonocardiaceae bacterium]